MLKLVCFEVNLIYFFWDDFVEGCEISRDAQRWASHGPQPCILGHEKPVPSLWLILDPTEVWEPAPIFPKQSWLPLLFILNTVLSIHSFTHSSKSFLLSINTLSVSGSKDLILALRGTHGPVLEADW